MFIPTPPLTDRCSRLLALIAMCLLTEPSRAQLQRTITVDPSGNADFTTIQGAIDSIADNPADRWTILIYAGVYDEAVTLDGTQENIDLVGVDRDACIIAPTGTDENGATITSGTEASRNNTISNITIRTTDGHGIEIRKGVGGLDVTPRDIIIEDCVVEADGEGMDGIEGDDADAVLVRDCFVRSESDDANVVGNDWRIERVTARSINDGDIATAYALDIDGRDNLVVLDSDFESDGVCVHFTQDAANTRLERSRFASTTGVGGVNRAVLGLAQAQGVLVRYCEILSDGTVESDAESICVFSDGSGATGVVLEYCTLNAIGGEDTRAAIGVKLDIGDDIIVRECVILASNIIDATTPTAPAEAWGVASNREGKAIILVGGQIITESSKERETLVYDVGSERVAPFVPGQVKISGTRVSKWLGPVLRSKRPRSVVQRVLDVSEADSDAVLAATTLTTSEQEVSTSITSPDVYRVVTVTGSLAGMTQDVYVIGTNFAGDQITDKITLAGVSTITGVKPFATVTKIILPAKNTQLIGTQTVSIGTGKRLGLYAPIGAEGDVIQIGRMSSSASVYTVEDLSGFSVDEVHATVAPDTITAGDSFEFVVLSSQ